MPATVHINSLWLAGFIFTAIFAIVYPLIVDFTTSIIPQLLGTNVTSTLLVEGLVAIFGILGIFVIWRLREVTLVQSEQQSIESGEAV